MQAVTETKRWERWGGLPLGESCHVCRQPIELQDSWCMVVLRNKMNVSTCIRCWAMWPDEWKHGLK